MASGTDNTSYQSREWALELDKLGFPPQLHLFLAEHLWAGYLVSLSPAFLFYKIRKILLTFPLLWSLNIKMHINFPVLCLVYNLLSINRIFTIKNSWNHTSQVLEHSLRESPEDKKILPHLGTETSERALWLLLNETLNQFSCYRSQTNWWADSLIYFQRQLPCWHMSNL